MKAIVLIGGLGTRLRPATYDVPKQLIPLAGRSMLYRALDLLPSDLEEAVLATGYQAERISEYLAHHPYRFPLRTVPEATPLGTGGGMRNVAEGMSDPFYLANSDLVAEVEARALFEAHRTHGGLGAMLLAKVQETSSYGVATLDANDRITAFVEKPKPGTAPSNWVNGGLAVWRRGVLDRIPPGRPVSFEQEVLPGLLPEGVYGFRLDGYWQDAGTLPRLLDAQRTLFGRERERHAERPDGASGEGLVACGLETQAKGARLDAFVTLGDRVVVEGGARLADSIVMDGARIGAGAIVERSLVGPGASVRPGARVIDQIVARSPPPTPPGPAARPGP